MSSAAFEHASKLPEYGTSGASHTAPLKQDKAKGPGCCDTIFPASLNLQHS